MNAKFPLRLPLAVIVLLVTTEYAYAQLIAYESFAMPVGGGLAGSGSTATGWIDAGWTDGSDTHYRIIDPLPDLTFQVSGGALFDGSNRAVQLTTNPEPVPNGLIASRAFPAQNTTIYFSFLVRPVAVGTGSDTLSLRLSNGTSSLALVTLQPDLSQQYFNLKLLLDGGGGGTGSVGSQALYPSTTYLIVGRITWTNSTSLKVETWINPPAAYPGNGSGNLTKTVSGSSVFSLIGFGISSSDTAGPISTAIFDEIRIGYTWADVVIPSAPPALVPDVKIASSIKLSWQSQYGKTYQSQYSYNLTTWIDLGAVISGNGQIKELFDSTKSDAKKFYRIQVQ